ASVSAAVLVLGDYFLFPQLTVPRSILLMDWGTTILAVGALRASGRLLDERKPPWFLKPWFLKVKGVSVFIVGVNNSNESLLRNVRRNADLSYEVVGFVARHQHLVGSRIGDVPVIGTIDQTCDLAEKYGVSEVLTTAGELPGCDVRRLVEEGNRRRIRVRVLPSYGQLLRGNVKLQPRTVCITDLLGREPVKLDLESLHQWISGKVIMVTGSAGSIGSEICRQLLRFGPKQLILVDRCETGQFFLEHELRGMAGGSGLEVCMADICDANRMSAVFEEYRPSIVFHAAAYKHVPLMERHPGEAVKNITLSTKLLADIADRVGVQSFVMISTDKAVNPTSVMGACKRAAELYVQELARTSDCRFVTVRFGNVLDSAGSVVPIFRQQIARGGPVTVTHPDMTRFFMTIPEASQLVIQAGILGHGGEIFALDMGEPIRIVSLAEDMIRLSGLRPYEDIDIEFTGCRPGERLREELRVDGEKHLKTTQDKILVVASYARNHVKVAGQITQLQKAIRGEDAGLLLSLRHIVPEYKISNPRRHKQAA
ncbi:MAG: nucleoside-diphosphate sugar epimerase/dehydratase, partial [Pirellulaceae bacterium]